jgi:S1-C subfamily serine protease
MPCHIISSSRACSSAPRLRPCASARAASRSRTVEYEPRAENSPDERLGLVVAPAHTGLRRRAAVGLAPLPGLLVESVRPGGPGAAAGIRAGDLLVRTPTRELRSLTCLAQAIDGVRAVAIDVIRGDVDVTITVKVPRA